jgi:class 3 adenylate cyclase/TolB-like protein
MTQSRRLAAIMFTDIVGYTAIMGKSEQWALECLALSRQIQKPIIEQYRGQWIKELGDGVMASFNSVSDAVHAAIKIQQACSTADRFQLRIGIHLGEVVMENEDVFGDGVNIASRIQALASPGGIWISEAVHQNVANKQGIRSEFLRMEELKNVRGPIRIYQIIADGVVASVQAGGNSRSKVNFPDGDSVSPADSVIERQTPIAGLWSTLVKKGNSRWKWVTFLVSLFLIFGWIIFGYLRRSGDAREEVGIVVMAFEDYTEEKNYGWLGHGLSEQLIHSLSAVQGMFVIGKTSSFYFEDHPTTPTEIGKQLGVDYLLSGSLISSGGDVRVIGSLSRASDGQQIWSIQFDRASKSLYEIQTEIVEEIVSAVPKLVLQSTHRKPMSDDVYKWVLQGSYFESRSENEKAREAYLNAIERDSTCAPALVGYGVTFLFRPGIPSDSAFVHLRRYCEKALMYEPGNVNAMSWLAWLSLAQECNYSEAARMMDRVVTLAPHLSQVVEVQSLLRYIVADYEAVERIGSRMKKRDPLNPRGFIVRGAALIGLERLDEAEQEYKKALSFAPENSGILVQLGEISMIRNEPLEAFRYWNDPRCFHCWKLHPIVYAVLGDRARSQELLDSVISVYPEQESAAVIAAAYYHLGETDSAYAWLQRTLDRECLSLAMSINNPIYFKAIRKTKRFQEVIRPLQLPAFP